VGSVTHQGEIPGPFHGTVNVLEPAPKPMLLPMAPAAPDYGWSIGDAHGLTVDDYLTRQRITGLLIVKDGVIQIERYQYDRKPTDRFTSESMAKSITALAIGIALGEGKIRSLDDPAERYVAGLRGTLYGATSIRNLLRMASGARYLQNYDFTGDTRRFSDEISRAGVEAAAHLITEREAAEGTRFHYASSEAAVLGAVMRGASGFSLSAYLTPRLWQAIGAEKGALWRADRTGLEMANGVTSVGKRTPARWSHPRCGAVST
jgi:CubicO group peptidase (beta-lactamase class C family)